MATYFHHHHHHNHQGSNSDDGALQTLILMNPNFVGYSDAHAPPPQSPPPSNFLFHAPTLYHAPPPLPPHLVGIPLHSTGDPNGSYAHPQASHAQHYAAWAQFGSMPTERESPRAQQGLSLTLSSNNHSFAVSGQGHQDQLQPSPGAAEPGIDSSESPVASAGDVHGAAALMTSSKYLRAAQELLEEVVNVSVDRVKPEFSGKKSKSKGESSSPSAVAGEGPKEEQAAAELTDSDKHEIQMKKAKLITLLDEVDQRHRQYHHQMQAVVGSFEQVAGPNSARTYTSLALKTILSQFRCLRGAITGQIKAANKALGEGEGEGGSRLKFLDHHMRQQRALQQLGMMQNNAWRPQRGLPEKAVSVLRAWLFEHFLHPYPKDSDKVMLAKQTGLTRSQVSNWFINARVRLWKPMIEEMYAEEVKEHEQNGSDGKSSRHDQHEEHGSRSVTDEKDHNVGGDHDQAKAVENHNSSSIVISDSAENPFNLAGSSKMDGESQGGLKKQRNNEMLSSFPGAELFNNGSKKQEDCSMMPGSGSGYIGGLLSYPIGEIGRFGDGQFPASFSGNGVSLTLGLESLSMPGNNQAFLPNNQDMDQYRGRLEIGELSGFGGVKAPNSSHSGNAYAAQLLHDFVA